MALPCPTKNQYVLHFTSTYSSMAMVMAKINIIRLHVIHGFSMTLKGIVDLCFIVNSLENILGLGMEMS